MKFTIKYGEKVVKEDIPNIEKANKARIKKAIDSKLSTSPELFGKPLRKSLVGFRKLRVGNYRIIFEISEDSVIVWAIGHRRNIYEIARKRI